MKAMKRRSEERKWPLPSQCQRRSRPGSRTKGDPAGGARVLTPPNSPLLFRSPDAPRPAADLRNADLGVRHDGAAGASRRGDRDGAASPPSAGAHAHTHRASNPDPPGRKRRGDGGGTGGRRPPALGNPGGHRKAGYREGERHGKCFLPPRPDVATVAFKIIEGANFLAFPQIYATSRFGLRLNMAAPAVPADSRRVSTHFGGGGRGRAKKAPGDLQFEEPEYSSESAFLDATAQRSQDSDYVEGDDDGAAEEEGDDSEYTPAGGEFFLFKFEFGLAGKAGRGFRLFSYRHPPAPFFVWGRAAKKARTAHGADGADGDAKAKPPRKPRAPKRHGAAATLPSLLKVC